MSDFDPAVLATFLERNAEKLFGIINYSRGQWSKGDLTSEAWLAAIDLGKTRGHGSPALRSASMEK